MSRCELTVIIPARDALATLPEQIAALAGQEWDGAWEVVVVDDRSSDGTAEWVAQRASRWQRLRLLGSIGARGPGEARRAGMRASTAPLLAFCDADDVVGPRWLAAMGEGLRAHEFVTGPIDYARLNPRELATQRGSFGSGFSRLADLVPVASSCNFGVRRDVLEGAGGFSALEVGEDLDTSYRLWRAGARLHFAPDAVVHYRLRRDARGQFLQALRYGAVHPLLMEQLRRDGVARPSRLGGVRGWGWLLRTLPRLADREVRARWIFTAGTRLGRLQGSLRHRSLYL